MSHLIVDVTAAHLHFTLSSPSSSSSPETSLIYPVNKAIHLLSKPLTSVSLLVSDERDKMLDKSQLHSILPCDRGYLANLTVFMECLNYIVSKHYSTSSALYSTESASDTDTIAGCNHANSKAMKTMITHLVIIHPLFLPHTLSSNLDLLVLHDLSKLLPSLSSYLRVPSQLPLTHLPTLTPFPPSLPILSINLGTLSSSITALPSPSQILPLTHIRLTPTLKLLQSFISELIKYQSFDISGDDVLIADFVAKASGRRGVYWLPENKGDLGRWEGVDEVESRTEDNIRASSVEKMESEGDKTIPLSDSQDVEDIADGGGDDGVKEEKEEDDGGEQDDDDNDDDEEEEEEEKVDKKNSKFTAKKNRTKKKKFEDDSDSGVDSDSDNESMSAKRARLLAERDARRAAASRQSQAQKIPVKALGDLIPLLPFFPSILDIPEAGVHDCVVHSVNRAPEQIRSLLYKNIVVTGSLSRLNGVSERLKAELRSAIPDIYEVNITFANDDESYNVRGAAAAVRAEEGVFRDGYVPIKEGMLKECANKFDEVTSNDNIWSCSRVNNGWEGIRAAMKGTTLEDIEEQKNREKRGSIIDRTEDDDDVVTILSDNTAVNGNIKKEISTIAAMDVETEMNSATVPVDGEHPESTSSATTTGVKKARAAPAKKKQPGSKFDKPAKQKPTDKANKAPTKRAAAAGQKKDPVFALGDLVEARFQRQLLWYKGEIVKVIEVSEEEEGQFGKFRYDISYEDGDFDGRMEGRFIRARKKKEKKEVASSTSCTGTSAIDATVPSAVSGSVPTAQT